jgi:membrane fusion protein (multidrug efflux system)
LTNPTNQNQPQAQVMTAPSAAALTMSQQASSPGLREEALPKKSRARWIGPLILLALIGYGANAGWQWLNHGRFILSTEDAYVKADMSVIASKISGYVIAVSAPDNKLVKAGDVLARIDDGDYRLAVEAARRKVETQDITIIRIGRQSDAARALIDQADALVEAALADQQRANLEFERATSLMKTQTGTQQRLDLAVADRDRTKAAVQSALAQREGARTNLMVLEAQQSEARQQRAELETAVARAERDLAFTQIRAPFDGLVGNRAVQIGQFAQPGTRLLTLIAPSSTYIEANFKETQLEHMQIGQSVDIKLDALSGKSFEGKLDSLSPASGSQFSLLPPENATGNFTKIVQRVPVRISLPAEALAAGLFKPGMSVIAEVNTRDKDAPNLTWKNLFGLVSSTH